MQTFNGGSDLNQHAILHNTSISNMKFIPHTYSCIHQSGLQKGFVTFSKRTDIYKRKQMQKVKIQRKVGIVQWRERRGWNGRKPAERSSEGACEVIDESLVGPTDSGDSSWRSARFDESLVDAGESGDSAFPSGDFSVRRSRRPFSASQASEQLSLVSASREGPINFPFKFSGCWTCGAPVANWESSK